MKRRLTGKQEMFIVFLILSYFVTLFLLRGKI